MKTKIISLPYNDGPSEDVAASFEPTPGCLVLAIADGVGSYSGGGLAASLTIEALENEIRGLSGPLIWREVFDSLRSRLQDVQSDKRLGTTLTAVSFAGGVASVGHVGDCRLYHLRGSGILTRTKDQTEVQYLLDQGVLNKIRAATYPRKNALMSLLSPEREFDLFESTFSVNEGDRIVICSDGFYQAMSKQGIIGISESAKEFALFAKKMYESVVSANRTDDATCIVAEL